MVRELGWFVFPLTDAELQALSTKQDLTECVQINRSEVVHVPLSFGS